MDDMGASPRLPQLRCRLEPIPESIAGGQTLSYAVLNTGDVPIMFGAEISLDWEGDGRWQRLPFGGWVAAVGITVEAGHRSKPISVEVTKHLAPGRYRLTKRISRGWMPQPDSITACCAFTVVMFQDDE